MTYDIIIPAPGAAMRKSYMELEKLRRRQYPFEMKESIRDITDKIYDKEAEPHYLVLAEKYNTIVPFYPGDFRELITSFHSDLGVWSFKDLSLEVEPGYEVDEIRLDAQIGKGDKNSNVDLFGTNFHFTNRSDAITDRWWLLHVRDSPDIYLKGASGKQVVTIFFDGPDRAWIRLTVRMKITEARIEQWKAEVWRALYDAAFNKYLNDQQAVANDIAHLEQQLAGVDTLTLRREESEEVMKSVLRFLLGPDFEFMPASVSDALKEEGAEAEENAKYGVAFTGHTLKRKPEEFAIMKSYGEMVRFLNQAIEWENVITFLYSYFLGFPGELGFHSPDPSRGSHATGVFARRER
jgi:hypothetical protein